MKLYNLKDATEQVSFRQAVKQGLGRNQGLFFPEIIQPLNDIDGLLDMPFVERSSQILAHLIGDEIPFEQMTQLVNTAFQFGSPPLVSVGAKDAHIYALELFHGPTLAFKDFGGRFLAQVLAFMNQLDSPNKKITILTATSGDTGAAVAHAFYEIPNINVVVLYPKGKISHLQAQLFCTLGKNITAVAVHGDFDDCQALVKQAFDDAQLVKTVGLNSANSINISRLLAQICYYFEAVAQLPKKQRGAVVFSVPSGNFGNLTAGLLAKALGLPIKRFIAATNANDTVPRYLNSLSKQGSGQWLPDVTKATLSNAMDVSQPNNWPRVEALFKTQHWSLLELGSGSVSDEQTVASLQELYQQNYLCEPHGAIAYRVLKEQLQPDETGIFLCTAHPAKFKSVVDIALGLDIALPKVLADHALKENLSLTLEADMVALKKVLLKCND